MLAAVPSPKFTWTPPVQGIETGRLACQIALIEPYRGKQMGTPLNIRENCFQVNGIRVWFCRKTGTAGTG
ncbi:MAG: hypothetical protein OXN17_08000 [Candidatus Poribacteria bacterium]|nr:hypothetical protein [Candidatus Poribacteria bacterium]MDE0506983.1 hypothetical protein [Candidatus Poribacteria bacterium]